MDTLRQKGGLSGFPKPSESPYDAFVAGHSSTSISVAAGLARAKSLKNEPGFTIAVIGDGAFTGGLAYEALNNAGHYKDRIIVVLNDNEMSAHLPVIWRKFVQNRNITQQGIKFESWYPPFLWWGNLWLNWHPIPKAT